MGNITEIEDNSGTGAGKTIVFGYDDLYRLTSASTTAASSTPFSEAYAYSPIGNLTSKTGQGSYAYSETGTANPQAATTIGSTTLAYDANGNLTSAASSTYAWDWRNRLASANNGTATTTYAYDHAGERVKKTAGATSTIFASDLYNTDGTKKTKHIFAGGELLATIETAGATSTVQYIHADHLGSMNAATDGNGEVVQVADYYPFGTSRIDMASGAFDEQRKYIGEEYDEESSLSYLNARYYEGARGQFLSQDPVFLEDPNRQNLENPQSLNSYSYANGNPVNLKDPTGRIAGVDDLAVLAAVAAVLTALSAVISNPSFQQANRQISAQMNSALMSVQSSIAASAPMVDMGGEYFGPNSGISTIPLAPQSSPWMNINLSKEGNAGIPKPHINVPTGTKPIDAAGLPRGTADEIKQNARIGPNDWTGVAPNGDVITGTPSGEAVNLGPADDYTQRPTGLVR